MFLSVRRCAEPMTRLHRLKVKVTLQSHGIYPSIRVRSVSPELFERFSLTLTQMFLSVRWYAETMIQGQGHTSRSWNLPLNFESFKSPQLFVRFSLNVTQMFLSVSWCAEPMTRLCKLKVKVGHTSRSWKSVAGDMAVLHTAFLYATCIHALTQTGMGIMFTVVSASHALSCLPVKLAEQGT